MAISLHDIKRIMNPQKDTDPVDDFRIIDSWTEYDEDPKKTPEERNLNYLCYELEVMNPETGEITHFYKAIKFLRIIRLPAGAKQSTAFMDMQEAILSGVYESNINLITIIANVIKPVSLGLLFLYGVQGVSPDIEKAKEKAHNDFKGLIGMLQATFQVLEMQNIQAKESEWLRNKMYNMDYLTVVRGIPKAINAGMDAGNKGVGGANLNPDSQGTLEEMIIGMADYEYVIEVISTPVFRRTLEGWQTQSQKEMTEWYSQLQGQRSISMNLSVPMMYMANASQAQGWSQAYTDASTISYAQGESFNFSEGQSVGESLSQSFGQSVGYNEGMSVTNSVSKGVSVSEGFSQGMSFGENSGLSVSDGVSAGMSASYNEGVNQGISANQNEGISFGTNVSQSEGYSQGGSYNVSEGESVSGSHSVSQGESIGYNQSQSVNIGNGASYSQNSNSSIGNSVSENYGYGQGYNVGGSQNTTHTEGHNSGFNGGINGSAIIVGANAGLSNGESASNAQSVGWNAGYSNSFNHSLGASSSSNVSFGEGVSQSESLSLGQSAGVNQGYNVSESYGETIGKSLSESWGVNESINNSQSIGQSTGYNASYGTGISQGNSQSYGLSQNIGQNTSVSQSQGESFSKNVGQNVGISQSETLGQSVGQTVGKSVSQSSNTGYGQNISKSESVSNGQSYTTSNGTSQGTSAGTSGTSSLGTSGSMGLGPSIGYSKSYQWLDQEVKDLLELMEYQNERIKKALRGMGAFYTYIYIGCPNMDALSTAQAVAKSTWQNEFAKVQPLQVLNLTETEQKHLLYHFMAFSSDVTRENVYGVDEYKYCTVLLPEEYVAYTHLPRVNEGGVFSTIQDIPKFVAPSMMKGEIYMGTILNSERWTVNNGYRTPFDYRIAEESLLHGFFTGASRSGKTVAALRFIAELSQVRRKKTGKRLRIVVMDPKQDWRTLARFVEPERFNFYSMGNVNFRPIKINPWKVPKGVQPQIWIDGIIDIYCRAYGLLERGKQMIASVVYELYGEAGVFVACDKSNWKELVPELSARVNFTKIYQRMLEKKVELENPNSKQGRAGNDTRDAYARLLERLSCFEREFSIERRLYGGSDGLGIDELIGDDDVTVLESKGLENTFKNFIFGAITSGFFKYALAHDGGYLADDQYETVLVIEEANEILTGSDNAGSGGGNQTGLSGQSEFEMILDQAAGYGLFVFAITQKIADMPSSIVANSGLVFVGKINRAEDVSVCIRVLGREERLDDRDLVKWFPRSPTGWFVCKSSRTFDYKDAEPILVQISRLNINPPSNMELDELLLEKKAKSILKLSS